MWTRNRISGDLWLFHTYPLLHAIQYSITLYHMRCNSQYLTYIYLTCSRSRTKFYDEVTPLLQIFTFVFPIYLCILHIQYCTAQNCFLELQRTLNVPKLYRKVDLGLKREAFYLLYIPSWLKISASTSSGRSLLIILLSPLYHSCNFYR